MEPRQYTDSRHVGGRGGVVLHIGAPITLGLVAREQMGALRAEGWDVRAACAADGYERYLRADGIPVLPIRLGHRGGLRSALRGAQDVFRLLRGLPVSLVHTHNAHHGVVGRLVARVLGVPAVHTWRYDPLDAVGRGPSRMVYGVVEAAASRAGRFVLFQNSEDMESAVARRLVPRDKAVYVGNGIHVEAFREPNRTQDEVRRDLGVPCDCDLVLCVARLAERKGQRHLVRGLRSLLAMRPRAQVVLVGAGPDEPDLRQLAIAEGVADHLHLAGHRDDVRDLLHASDALCLPSRREGVPRAVMEAMAAGLPVVGCDVVGTRAVVEDGTNGLLVPYGDPEALAAALARVLDDGDLRSRLSRAGYETVSRDWPAEAVTRRVAKVYEDLLAGPV